MKRIFITKNFCKTLRRFDIISKSATTTLLLFHTHLIHILCITQQKLILEEDVVMGKNYLLLLAYVPKLYISYSNILYMTTKTRTIFLFVTSHCLSCLDENSMHTIVRHPLFNLTSGIF